MSTQAGSSRAGSELVLDVRNPQARTFVTIGGLESAIGLGSMVDAVAIINAINVRTAELRVARRAMPAVIARASAVGAKTSKTLFDESYREHAQRLARVLDEQGGGRRGHEPHDSGR